MRENDLAADVSVLCTRKKLREGTMDFVNTVQKRWKGRDEFLSAQGQVAVVLIIAYIGNNWEPSYPRNDNHSMPMFWAMNGLILIVALATMKHDPDGSARGIQLLSRSQTEEWKGWMQWAFIMVR
jgi:10 TM Acyl Transferase domain found in Cas1p